MQHRFRGVSPVRGSHPVYRASADWEPPRISAAHSFGPCPKVLFCRTNAPQAGPGFGCICFCPEGVQGFHLLLPMASADEHRLSAPVGQFTAWHPEAQHMGNAVNHTARVEDGAAVAADGRISNLRVSVHLRPSCYLPSRRWPPQEPPEHCASPSHQDMRDSNPRTVSVTPYRPIDVGCRSYLRNLAALMWWPWASRPGGLPCL